MLHTLDWLRDQGGCTYLCCVYPTAVFLDPRTLQWGLQQLITGRRAVVVSVTKYRAPLQRALRMDDERGVHMIWPENEPLRSQDLMPSYHDVGQFYWIDPEKFRQTRSLINGDAEGVEVPHFLANDINTESEWIEAENLYVHFRTKISHAYERVRNLPPSASRLILGTAQLGFDYGIANATGKPSSVHALEILTAAWLNGVRFFDTAQSYGDSERILGEFLSSASGLADARIITKLRDIPAANRDVIRAQVRDSIQRLGGRPLWALLLHKEQNLEEWQHGLGEILLELKADGLVENLGVSIYTEHFARSALAIDELDIIQMPGSVFDRRMHRSGLVQAAHNCGKFVMLRSIYLQGLAMLEPGRVPRSIPHAVDAVTAFNEFCQRAGRPLDEMAFRYVRARFPTANYVMGAETEAQVRRNAILKGLPPLADPEIAEWDRLWPEDYPELVNASLWGLSVKPKG